MKFREYDIVFFSEMNRIRSLLNAVSSAGSTTRLSHHCPSIRCFPASLREHRHRRVPGRVGRHRTRRECFIIHVCHKFNHYDTGGAKNSTTTSSTTARCVGVIEGSSWDPTQSYRHLSRKTPFAPCNIPYGRTLFPELERQPTNSTRMNYDLSTELLKPTGMAPVRRKRDESACMSIVHLCPCSGHPGDQVSRSGELLGRLGSARTVLATGTTVGPFVAVVGLRARGQGW